VLKTLDVLTPKCLAIMHLTARGRFSVLQDPEHHGNSMAVSWKTRCGLDAFDRTHDHRYVAHPIFLYLIEVTDISFNLKIQHVTSLANFKVRTDQHPGIFEPRPHVSFEQARDSIGYLGHDVPRLGGLYRTGAARRRHSVAMGPKNAMLSGKLTRQGS
jgi:hypothetical protein